MAQKITSEALRSRLDAGEPTCIVDVRDGEDFAEWSIPGAINCDAYEALGQGRPGPIASFEPPARDIPVVTVCYQGNTSQLAAELLRARGIDAVSLAGGMIAWSGAWNVAEIPLGGATDARVIQVRRTGKGCLSYIVASHGDAAVIDPSLDAELYVALAREHGWTIRHVVETHVHADHLSRARALAALTDAPLHMPRTKRIHFDAVPLDEGSRIRVGAHDLVALATPGHTNESFCYQFADRALFTGDTLFLDGVGRPDLEADAAGTRARAGALHASLARIVALGPDTLILPAHTSDPVPFDKRPLAARVSEIRGRVPMLALGRPEFVARLTADLPETPPNHKVIVQANEAGSAAGLDQARLEAGANRCAIR